MLSNTNACYLVIDNLTVSMSEYDTPELYDFEVLILVQRTKWSQYQMHIIQTR